MLWTNAFLDYELHKGRVLFLSVICHRGGFPQNAEWMDGWMGGWMGYFPLILHSLLIDALSQMFPLS